MSEPSSPALVEVVGSMMAVFVETALRTKVALTEEHRCAARRVLTSELMDEGGYAEDGVLNEFKQHMAQLNAEDFQEKLEYILNTIPNYKEENEHGNDEEDKDSSPTPLNVAPINRTNDVNYGWQQNCCSAMGITPLHAILLGATKSNPQNVRDGVQMLIDFGADVNAVSGPVTRVSKRHIIYKEFRQM